MCGICGAAGAEAVQRMNDAMTHRGPDDDGVHLDEAGGFALGARRLAIIDVEGGHQPLANEDGTIWAVLNGEIYNHPALRRRLAERGHRLATATDTEVLVHLYEDHGDALVDALEGMFAFAIWDAPRRRLLLARDRFGEKPLFHRMRDGVLEFASELGGLLAAAPGSPELDPGAVEAFLVLGYVPGPRSVLDGVAQLPPGSRLVWQRGEAPRVDRYWSSPAELSEPAAHIDEVTDEVEALLRASIRGRLLSDVPLGVFLSGGVDSTLVAALAAEESASPLKTFSVGYDAGGHDETPRARRVARAIGADHNELRLSSADVARRVRGLLESLDQPLADASLVATHALAEFAREQVTVVVGGEGADELFGGYPRYRWLARADRLDRTVPGGPAAMAAALARAAPGRARRLADVVAPRPVVERHLDWIAEGRWEALRVVRGPRLREANGDAVVRMLRDRVDGADGTVAGRFMRLDQELWLPDDVLAKADRASMLASLELRTPFLHHEVAEMAALLPGAVHASAPGKVVLRRILRRRIGIRPERRKLGFMVPAASWLRGPLSGLLAEQLSGGAAYEEGWLDRAEVGRLVAEHRGGADRSKLLWPLLSFAAWLEPRV